MKLSRWLAVAVLAFSSGRALAHDFWIEPSTFRPAPGSVVEVALRVGEGFRGDPVGRSAQRIVKFLLRSPAGDSPIPGEEGADPAGVARITSPGLHVVGYRSNYARVDLPAEKFEQYLREEGLDEAIARRAARGESARPSRERYSRCVKSLLGAGDSPAGQDRPLGFTFEIVSDRNPYEAHAGEEMPFRVLFRGRPIKGVLVAAIPREAPDGKLTARSDTKGRVSFGLPSAGVWLVKAVHIEALPLPALPPEEVVDWESHWASVTFELPSPGDAAGSTVPKY